MTQSSKPAVLNTPALCPVCEAPVTAPADAIAGEILSCDDCGAELEITALQPLTVAEAPEVEEDWGE